VLNVVVRLALGQAISGGVHSQSGSITSSCSGGCCDGEVLTGDLRAEDGRVDVVEPVVGIGVASSVHIVSRRVGQEEVDGGALNEAVRHVGVQLGDAPVN
jgi:hypothetical protein